MGFEAVAVPVVFDGRENRLWWSAAPAVDPGESARSRPVMPVAGRYWCVVSAVAARIAVCLNGK